MQEELCQRAVHLFDRLGSHREDGEGWREKILAGPVEVMRVRAGHGGNGKEIVVLYITNNTREILARTDGHWLPWLVCEI